MSKHRGECFCGEVQFNCDKDPFFTQYCHCDKCREVASQTDRPMDNQGYAWTAGYLLPSLNITSGNLEEIIRNKSRLILCKSCHTLIYGVLKDADLSDPTKVGIGINAYNFQLSDPMPESFNPVRHVWYGNENRVRDFDDGLPKFEDTPKDQFGSGKLWDEDLSSDETSDYSRRFQ